MPLRTILALLDGSPWDQDVLRQAQFLATPPGRVVLVAAVPQSRSADETVACAVVADAARYLARIAAQPSPAGEVVPCVVYGDPAGAGLEEAFLRKADMLVMRLPAQHGFGYGTPGSVAEHVLARSPIPVFLVRAGSNTLVQECRPRDHWGILVPLDGSAFAEAALPVAAELAATFGGDITLLQVVPLANSLAPPGATVWDLHALDSLQLEACNYLRKVAGRLALKIGVTPPGITVRLGHAASAICEAVQDYSVQQVVMATHARARWRRLLVGSVTDQVLRNTSVPVVLVRPQAFEVAPADVASRSPVRVIRTATQQH